jgi:outer membrane protein, heavy metal efflux system
MKKLMMSLAILLFVSLGGSAQNLEEYLEMAAKNNPLIKAKFSSYMASLEVVPQVGTLPDPQLAFAYFIKPVETRLGPQQAKVAFTQMFPWFGTLDAMENVAIQNSKVKYEAFKEAKSNLFFEVKSAYYDLYFIRKAIKATSDNQEILNSFRNLALIKIESGKASGVDEIRVEMDLADLENNLALLRDKMTVLMVKFNKLLNQDGSKLIITPDRLEQRDLMYSREAVLDSILKKNHTILGLDYMIEALRGKQSVAEKAGKPKISLGIDYIAIGETENQMVSSDVNGNDAIIFPKIGMTVPLYRKKYTAMVNEVVLKQEATLNAKQAKSNALETLFEKSYMEYQDADRRISLYEKQLLRIDNAVKILESQYSTNGKNFEEILRMEKRRLKYQLQLEKSVADKQAGIAFIEFLMGQ